MSYNLALITFNECLYRYRGETAENIPCDGSNNSIINDYSNFNQTSLIIIFKSFNIEKNTRKDKTICPFIEKQRN